MFRWTRILQKRKHHINKIALKKIVLAIFGLFLIATLQAQDIHFSQFNASFLNLNPALTGQFDGDYRFNANYKNQWARVSEPYRTFSFAGDARNLIRKNRAISLGLVLFNDDAGEGGLRTTLFGLNVAYAKALNQDSTWALSVGIQTGLINRSIQFNQLSFDQQYQSGSFNARRNTGENFDRNSYSHFDFNAGFSIQHQIAPRKSVQFGVASFNLNSPNQSFLGDNIPLDNRWNIHAQADCYLAEDWDLLPALLYSRQGSFSELLFGTNARYRLSRSNFFKRNVYTGLWYRNKDAIVVSAGMDYNQWTAGLSYDINLSDLDKASNQQGGLEISIVYIIKTYQPIKKRFKRCPRYL